MTSAILAGALFKRLDSDKAALLSMDYNLNSLNFLMRGKAKEIIRFGCRTVAERVQLGQSGAINNAEFLIYFQGRGDGLIIMIVTDESYPASAGREACRKLFDDFDIRHTGLDIRNISTDTKVHFPELASRIRQFQDPMQADKSLAIQNQLNETKRIMVQNIDTLLARGEQVEDLIDASVDLSQSAKMFAKQARKTNRCCVAM